MKNLFVKEEVNTSRQFAFDFAKAITLYFMVTTHCFEYLYESGEGMLFYIFVVIIDVLLGASVYVGSMGLGLAYNRNKTPIDFIKRGLKLFFAGYLLNILREGSISEEGIVAGCCIAQLVSGKYPEELIIGDMKKNLFHEIWNGKKMNSLRLSLIDKPVGVCAKCNHYKQFCNQDESLASEKDRLREYLLKNI